MINRNVGIIKRIIFILSLISSVEYLSTASNKFTGNINIIATIAEAAIKYTTYIYEINFFDSSSDLLFLTSIMDGTITD